MDKAFGHNQDTRERTACANIRRLVTHMDRSERLAVVLLISKYLFDQADKLTGLAEISLTVNGSQPFNNKANEIKLLFPRLPTRSLAEIAVDILLPELTTLPPNT